MTFPCEQLSKVRKTGFPEICDIQNGWVQNEKKHGYCTVNGYVLVVLQHALHAIY